MPNPATATAANTLPGVHCQASRDSGRVHHRAVGGAGPDSTCEPGATLPGPPLVQPGFRHRAHPAGCMGAVRAAGGPFGKPTPWRQGRRATWGSGGVTAARGESIQMRAAAAADHRPGATTEKRGAVPIRSHAPGYGRAKVLVYGLFAAASGLGASAAAGGEAGGRAGITGGDGSGLHRAEPGSEQFGVLG